ncbi:MAG: ABC transporter ATP-binding protein [Anaerolineae bacterium]|nr:ABC transporter ATP-binding protein [Anaerolineae bacterium]
MSRPSLVVEGVSKRYYTGEVQNQQQSARQMMMDMLRAPLQRTRSLLKYQLPSYASREFWALRDISFTVHPGEVVGIIGHNGAGKSTLLKILSRITEPTEGVVRGRGRMASLIEVGTGFHPELTGRENVYLNGSILGMTTQEIRESFDAIVAFSGVPDDYIDTPVKRYSSGMRVRLGFAVAAHLRAEILLVDEVLSVGDLAFQQKCLGKMQDLTQEEGRTVLFVSHNLAATTRLCPRSIWLDHGRLRMDASTDQWWANTPAHRCSPKSTSIGATWNAPPATMKFA